MKLLISVIKKLLPDKINLFLIRKIKTPVQQYQYKLQQKRYPKIIENIKKKDKIIVTFFLIHGQVWKLDELFKMMLLNKRFEPVIIICPYIVYGHDEMIETMNRAEEFVKTKGYPYMITYNQETNSWLDVRNEIKPDIIFFTNPYYKITNDDYYILNYPNSLTCYVPYSSMICSTPVQYNKPLQCYVWKFFLENDLIHSINKEKSPNKGQNTEITGSPLFDIFLDKNYQPKNVWKHSQTKKIIWAPHHTIDTCTGIKFSNFLYYADFMIDVAVKYSAEIQFAFKPHPILYPKLINLWGKEKTDKYYAKWESMENTQVVTGDYIDLFCTSDAMIFDSVSFINEYLYIQKPSLFIYNNDIDEQLNEFGLKALSCHQKAKNEEDIINFIERMIAGIYDPKKDLKQEYYNRYLVPPNNQSASKNIMDTILKTLS
jgi:hypothetical protein